MRIRHATVDDAASISRVHVDSWRTTYRGMVPDHVIDSLDYERNTIRWRDMLSNMGEMKCFLVAETFDGEVVGFATGGPNRELDTGFNGELYAIYVLRDHHRRGVGKNLVLEIADWLYRHRYTSMLVWVLEKNPAKYFYESMGGCYVSRKKLDIGGAMVDEISYGWRNLTELLDPHTNRM
jgi:GNAT superfamily N-acetyltransferase